MTPRTGALLLLEATRVTGLGRGLSAGLLALAKALVRLNDGTACLSGTRADQVLVTGAGFGVLAAESVLPRLREGQPPAARVRVDALASAATEPGVIGGFAASKLARMPLRARDRPRPHSWAHAARNGHQERPPKDGSGPATAWPSLPPSPQKSRNDCPRAKVGQDHTPLAPSSGQNWR